MSAAYLRVNENCAFNPFLILKGAGGIAPNYLFI